MKLITLSFAGLLAATTLVPSAATAQPGHGGRHYRDDDRRGWDGSRGWDRRDNRRDDRRDWRGDRGGRGWRGDRGWRDNRYAWNGYRGREAHTVCRWVDGYYGPQRRCFRVR